MSPSLKIIREIDARLAELRPLFREYEQLEEARRVLTQDEERSAPATPRRSASPRANRRPAAAGRRAPRGANRTAILAYVERTPGARVAEIAEATGIPKPTVHSTVYGLKRNGVLIPEGDGVRVAGTTNTSRPTSSRRTSRTSGRRNAAKPRRAQAPGTAENGNPAGRSASRSPSGSSSRD
jgi:hypothetical protein